MDKKELKKIIERLKKCKIDERLKEDLLHLIDNLSKTKKFGLSWDSEKDLEDVVVECINKMPVLKNIKNKTIKNKGNNQNNILIEGDNYHALQVLNQTHMGKVDVIYIDPPYNTGKKHEWKYNDRFVNPNDGYKHSKWLNMMDRRLRLAKNLLSKSGAIFISIDDNEQANLKLLCDDIFGEKNFVECISWDKKSSAKGVPPLNMIVNTHEYILVYQKSSNFSFKGEIRDKKGFSNPDNDARGLWRNTNIKSTTKSKESSFTITDPATGNKFKDTWAFSEKEIKRLIDEKYLIFPKSKNGQVRKKEFLKEFKNENIPIKSSWGLFDNQQNTEMLKKILPNVLFLNPKPLALLKYLLYTVSGQKLTIVDFFAGSGTTGHAVLELNKEDGGNRQFILCTNNENKIAEEVTYPRIKKVIEGYKKNGDGDKIEGLGGGLHYYRTDFVDIDIDAINDNDKLKVSRKIGYVLGIKNNCFEEIEFNDHYQVFENADEGTGIFIYFEEDLSKFDDFIKSIKGKKGIVYLYSGGTKKAFGLSGKEYKDIKLEKIPERFLSVYKDCIS